MGKELYEFGPFRVNPEKQTLLRGDELIALNPKTFQLLLVLLRHGNQIVTKDELMKSVWPDTFVEETNLTRNIFALRKALGDSQQNRYIITVPGQGYRLAEGVRLVSETDLRIVAASHSKVQIHGPGPEARTEHGCHFTADPGMRKISDFKSSVIAYSVHEILLTPVRSKNLTMSARP
jgi:DNA-binding winged helix-turn-helix (wHTH) protein